jgi:hypothetical protein
MLITYLIITKIFGIRPEFKSNSFIGRLLKLLTNPALQKSIVVYKKGILAMLLFLISTSFTTHKLPDEMVLLKTMIAQAKSIDSMSYTMCKTERIENKMVIQKSFIKWSREPFKVQIKQLAPNNGLEVVYIENKNNNKAQINPNGFPWVSLNLSPFNKKMRKNQHHTLYESGFDYFISILEHMIEKYGTAMNVMVSVNQEITWNNVRCWVVEIANPHFKYIPYTVTSKDETLLSIAKKNRISEYMILEKNEEVTSYTDIVPGQTIIIPNDYSPKIILYIDQEMLTPCQIRVEDENGLFEKYEMTSLKIYSDTNSNVIAFK